MKRRILLAEDSDRTRQSLKELLQADDQIEVDTADNGDEAVKALEKQNYSIGLIDLKMPGLNGMQLIEEVQKRKIPVTLIVMTGYGSINEAVQAMRLGAYDFLTKPIDMQHLRLVIDRALRDRLLHDEVAYLREQIQGRWSFHNILSKNPRMHSVFELIGNLAQTTTTVLIEGETGTGKEEVARAIHEATQGRSGPMIPVNCAALPENLLESELFGHEKGAFTTALNQRRGRFELANEGTIFLDEVGDIPPAMQAKLLRVLQERRFERVGGVESIEVDVRVIAATNRSLLQMVQDGKFREDLYYRLNVLKIDLPPLRERSEDIPLLAAHFAQKYTRPGEAPKQFSPHAMDALLRHSWPGNIRELENAIERSCVTCLDGTIQLENLPTELIDPAPRKLPYAVDTNRPLPDLLREISADVERQYIRKALEQSHGHVGRCAKMCGLSRRTLSARIADFQINKAVFR